MSNLDTPGANSSRGLGGIQNGEPSDTTAQFSNPNAKLESLEKSRDELSSFGSTFLASEDDLPIDFASFHPPEITRNDSKRKAAISNHKGVHFKKKNKKFVSRLCLPGGRSRKLELGEYNTHDEAARAYQVGAFYYNKSSISDCGEDHSFLETLPCVPDNLSDAEKLAWVRERARHSAASIGTSERRGIWSSKRVLESGGSPFDARPGTPASYGTQGSCDDYHSTPTTPTKSSGRCFTMPDQMFNERNHGISNDQVDSLIEFPRDAPDKRHLQIHERFMDLRRKIQTLLSQVDSIQTQSQGSPNVELQQGGNFNALTNRAPVVDHQDDSQVKFTDSIIFALVELRKQGWGWILKRRSPSSVETGMLFSVSKGQHVAPAFHITDIITNSFHELREQGWEVHLQPHKGADVERQSEHFGIQVMVKFSYAKEKLVWEVLESGHSGKVEILWSEIDVMKATYSAFESDTLEIVSRSPSFFRGSTPWSDWEACTDFTAGRASLCMVHHLDIPKDVLKEHYEKLVQCDPRLKNADIRGQEWVSFAQERHCTVGSLEKTLETDFIF